MLGVEVVAAGGPVEREGSDGSEKVPDGPRDDHVVEESQECTDAHNCLKNLYLLPPSVFTLDRSGIKLLRFNLVH